MNNFDFLIKKILEDVTAGSGGALGTFNTNDWLASGTPGTDKYAPGDSRIPTYLGARKIKKGKKTKTKILIQRRPLVNM